MAEEEILLLVHGAGHAPCTRRRIFSHLLLMILCIGLALLFGGGTWYAHRYHPSVLFDALFRRQGSRVFARTNVTAHGGEKVEKRIDDAQSLVPVQEDLEAPAEVDVQHGDEDPTSRQLPPTRGTPPTEGGGGGGNPEEEILLHTHFSTDPGKATAPRGTEDFPGSVEKCVCVAREGELVRSKYRSG